MTKLFSSPRFLAAYSGILTVAFILTVALGLARGDFRLHKVAAAEQSSSRHADYDTITVHRINIVEPDGTPRLIIADKAEYPGSFFKGKELPRPDRTDAAGMLFMNDEGTENGGLIFGGHQSADGKFHSFGHLSFDEYEQDQTLNLETSQDGDERDTRYQISDNGPTLLTPDIFAAIEKIRAMPDGPEKQKARAEFRAKYPIRLPERAALQRMPDKSSELRLSDPEGHTRILLRVAPDGAPTMQFLDAAGKVTQQWPNAAQQPAPQEKK
jgi:hypothetical protein